MDGEIKLRDAQFDLLAGDIEEQLLTFHAEPSSKAFYDLSCEVAARLEKEGRFEEAADAYDKSLALGEEVRNNYIPWEEALHAFLAFVKLPFDVVPRASSNELALSRPTASEQEEALGNQCTCAICLEDVSQHTCFTCVPRPKEAEAHRGWTGCCGTQICSDCMTQYLRQKIMEGDTVLRCPGQCRRELDEAEVRHYVPSLWLRVEKLRKLRSNDSLRECPRCGCLNEGSRHQPDMTCASCEAQFCFHHGLAHPGQTCRQYNRTTRSRLAPASGSVSGFHLRTRLKVGLTTQACPRCHARVERSGGCAHMVCRCGAHFCWHCGKETNIFGPHRDHYSLFGSCRSSVMRGKRLGVVLAAPVALATAPIWGPALCIGLACGYDSD